MTYFNETQQRQIREANKRFKELLALGRQGQIVDGDSPAKIAAMKRILADPDKFIQQASLH